MAINQGFAYAYGWNVYYEKLLGMWSMKEGGFIARNMAMAYGFLTFISIWMPQMASLLIVWGDMTAMIDCLATNVSFSIGILKIVALQYWRKVISSILVIINADWGRALTKEQLEIMLDTGRISRFISVTSFGLTSMVLIDFIALQIWAMATNRKDHSHDPRLTNDFFFLVHYPFNTTYSFVFVPVWLTQLVCTITGGMCYAAPDSLVAMLVLHVCGQLRIIRISLENIVNETTIEEPKKYWVKLAAIVERHERLNELAIVIKNTFSSILLIQMFACSVTFCFESFLLFTTFVDRGGVPIPIVELTYFVFYIAYTLSHLFFYCYVGDRLLVESTSVANNFYEAGWYNLPPKEAKAFLLVCHRSKTPLEITAGKFCTFNLELFNAVLKNAMGYFSMLVAMKERLVDQ